MEPFLPFIQLILLLLGLTFAGVVLMVFGYWIACLSNWITFERKAGPRKNDHPDSDCGGF